ncbi:MAG: GNAT family protein [Chloroflexota bacterium]
MSDYFWQTERIRIRLVEPEDWAIHHQWDMNSEMQRNLYELTFPSSKTRAKQWTEETAKKAPAGDNLHMQITLRATDEVIGVLSSHDADRRNGTFMYGVAIRPEYQRQGYATEAILLLMRYFFDELRYQKCHVDIHGWNADSVQLHEKLGFVKEGQIRRAIYTQGTFHDRLIYGITREEFRAKHG